MTNHPLPDINLRLAPDGKGGFVLVWQGFRGAHSQILLKSFDGEKWSDEVQLTRDAANHWEPAVAVDSAGAAWVAYDSYRSGNYDVFLTPVRNGRPETEMPVAATPSFEARPTVAVDRAGRVWVAWEEGRPNWGKDQGYVIRDRQPGVPLGGFRAARIRIWDGQWREPKAQLAVAFPFEHSYQPHVFADGRGSIWVVVKIWNQVATGQVRPQLGYFEYWAVRLEAEAWSRPVALPNSKGRSSTRLGGSVASDGSLWMIWPTDGRKEPYYHRPRRQQVYAASLGSPRPAPTPAWAAPAASGESEVKAGHGDEAGDLAAIRGYRANIGKRTYRIARGDFHRHTELSWDGAGGNDGSLQDFYRYMLDAGGMDFGASTDHQGGHWPYWWWYTQKLTDMYHVPGAYVAIFGFERSVAYPDGHRNIFFANRSDSRVIPFYVKQGLRGFELPRGPVGDEPAINTTTGQLVDNDTKLLFEEVRSRNAISIPHTLGTTQGTDWRDSDPAIEPVVEIFQGLRTSYEAVGAPFAGGAPDDIKRFGYQPQGMASNAWSKGLRLGVIASSDHTSTHISYAMVYSGDFSRQGILDAIRKRHTYGAMDNIILDVRMGDYMMGDEFSLRSALPLKVKVRGTRAVARVEVIKDNKMIYTAEPGRRDVQFEYLDKVAGSGLHFYYVRVRQEDGLLAWSSPMFVNY